MIGSFSGPYRFLSNFYPAVVRLDGVNYPSVEHAYQAAKTLDLALRQTIRQQDTPGRAKRMGATVTKRPGFYEDRVALMTMLVRQKFHHPELCDKLLATGDHELVEGNTWGDTFWGECRGVGENHLGRILMQVRTELRSTLS